MIIAYGGAKVREPSGLSLRFMTNFLYFRVKDSYIHYLHLILRGLNVTMTETQLKGTI